MSQSGSGLISQEEKSEWVKGKWTSGSESAANYLILFEKKRRNQLQKFISLANSQNSLPATVEGRLLEEKILIDWRNRKR